VRHDPVDKGVNVIARETEAGGGCYHSVLIDTVEGGGLQYAGCLVPVMCGDNGTC